MLIIKTKHVSENKQKILTNVFWALLGKIVNMAGSLLVGILVARYLGPSDYGLMNYVISYVTIFAIISNFGLDNIEIRELARRPTLENQILGTAIRLRLFFAAIAFALIGTTLWIFEPDIRTTVLVLIYALSVFTNCFNLIRNYFTSIVKNKYVVKSEIFRTIIGAGIKVILVWLKAPLTLFILAFVFDTLLVSSGYIISYRQHGGHISNWKFDRTLVPFLLVEAFPLVLSGAAVVIYQRIDQVMIMNMIDSQSVGYFATADKFLGLILFLPTILVQTITPLLVQIRKDDSIRYEQQKYRFISIVVWSSIIIAAIVSASAHWLIRYSFGISYMAAIPVLQIIAWKTVGMALSASAGQIIIIEQIHRWAFIRNILGCILCVGLNMIFIPRYGIIGSAWVTIITITVSGCLSNIFFPAYHNVMKLQIKALLFGWKELIYLKTMFR